MPSPAPPLRPITQTLHRLLRHPAQSPRFVRHLSTTTSDPPPASLLPPPSTRLRSPYKLVHNEYRIPHKKIKTYPPPPSTRKLSPEPITDYTLSQISLLDPTGSRTRLFDRKNPDAPKPGDILLVTFKTGDPFAGVCLSIRRRGVDTGVLLRNRLLMTGVEMWVKVYSPNVRAVEVVKRAEKRARRARLFYMRKPKHDRGSVEKEVEAYLKRRRLIRSGALTVKDPKASAKRPEQAKSGVGAR